MNFEELDGYIKSTGKGARVDVRVRVYPGGFGQVIVRRSEAPIQPIEYMCNNIEEAVGYLRDIWSHLAQAASTTDGAASAPSQG